MMEQDEFDQPARNLFYDADSIESVVGQAMGYASVCWEDMSGTGVFQSEKAEFGLEQAMERINQIMLTPPDDYNDHEPLV